MIDKKSVLIIFGGASNEYEVSLRSAASMLENLDKEQFEPVLMGITKDGHWRLYSGTVENMLNDSWQQSSVPAILSPDSMAKEIIILNQGGIETKKIDVILPAMHGQNCEDGAIQGLFKLSKIPFVGSGVTASAIGFDKIFTHVVAEGFGIPMAKWVDACKEETLEEIDEKILKTVGYPCFVKPANSGSSVGCCGAKDKSELKNALDIAFLEDRRVVIEEHITAQEVECAVIGNLNPTAPTTGEIASPTGFYDYDTKYKNDKASLFIPAQISVESQEKVKELAVKVYKALNCRGLSRVDFFVKADGEILFNEINTLPGFTSISMYPKMITSSGISYSQLITQLIELALEEIN